MAIEKGTEEWMMFGDFFGLCKKYWDVSESDDYWQGLIYESNEFVEKYKDYPMSLRMREALFNAQRDKYKERR